MKFFDMEGPLMRGLGRIADLVWLNLLTLACCLPIVTAGASITALHYVALKLVRGEEGYIARDFFKSFRENFFQATILWLLAIICMAVIFWDGYLLVSGQLVMARPLEMLMGAAALLVLGGFSFVFPVLAKFVNTIPGTLKNGFVISLSRFPITLLMLLMQAIPVVLLFVSYRVIPLVFFFGFSLPAFGAAFLYNRFFRKLEDKMTKNV